MRAFQLYCPKSLGEPGRNRTCDWSEPLGSLIHSESPRFSEALPNLPSSEARKSGLWSPGWAGCNRAIDERYRGFVPDRAMWS